MKGKKHGGRGHSLSVSGTSKPKQVRLGDLATARLAALVAESGLTASEVVRALLLHPAAPQALKGSR